MSKKYLRVVSWAKFQHYKKRSPPWIKLHRELLTSSTWVSSSNEDRVLAIAIMMLAAASDNKIPADKAYVRRVAYLDFDPDFSKLSRLGFIEIYEEKSPRASTMLARSRTSLADARPETEGEAEKKEPTQEGKISSEVVVEGRSSVVPLARGAA